MDKSLDKASFCCLTDRCSIVSSWISNEMAKEPSLIPTIISLREITSMISEKVRPIFIFQTRTNSKGFTPKGLLKELERSPFLMEVSLRANFRRIILQVKESLLTPIGWSSREDTSREKEMVKHS